MNYEKKYKEALKWMQSLYDGLHGATKEDAEHYFPELKESEDEKIRKTIIEYIKGIKSWNYFLGISKEQMITWLEKQGEDILIEEIKRRKELYSQEKEKAVSSTEKLSLGGRIAMLEELCAFIDAKQDEEKSTDNVGPKFKVRDWITNGDYTWEVTDIAELDYVLRSQDGNIVDDTISYVDEHFHLWAIEDAKEGDVLVCKGNIEDSNGIKYERICLINNPDNAFFTLTKTSNYVEEFDIDVNIDYPDNTIPATKGQKEILFMAMKEAGYEWDADKKELKKIEVASKESGDEQMIERLKSCIYASDITPEGREEILTWLEKQGENKKLDADKVIGWLVANICDFEYYVKLFKKDFEL